MADLSNIGIDPNVEKNTGEFTVLPPGNYEAVIVGDELSDNKAGTGKILKLSVQIISGQFAGTVLKDTLNITNPSPVAQQIGQGVLKNICEICNVPFPPKDTTLLRGKPMSIQLAVEEFTSNKSGKQLSSNKIKKYAVKGSAPATPAPAQTSQQASPDAW